MITIFFIRAPVKCAWEGLFLLNSQDMANFIDLNYGIFVNASGRIIICLFLEYICSQINQTADLPITKMLNSTSKGQV